MLLNFVIKTVINGVALWIAALLVDGITFGDSADTASIVRTVLLVALIFGVLNTFVRPIAKLVSMPFIILTLGLFVFIINALMLQLTSWLADKFDLAFHVESFFWDAILGSLIITFVSMILGFFNPKD
ncbi:phage holin family protein [Intrasporangium calvum]|uniref:Phage holin family protein n=1 Tax=Intrasporangium calvum TaxID=53358 RepID=A0ABT5GHA3_9MICO|nr:phage holin family protein [Intrasporangium calvum]MDC5697625.1 phage holin family protein [Intrasporangium calvum]